MNQQLFYIGILIILLGFVVITLSAITGSQKDARVAVGGFIGFIPFGFANDKKLLWFVTIISVVMFFLLLNFFRLGK